MKRLLFAFATAGLIITATTAQKVDEAKTAMALSQFKMAKEKIDKAMAVPKESAKAEAYIAKAAIYGTLSVDSSYNAQQVENLINESEAAYKKYIELDPKMTLIKDPLYVNAPVYLYQYFYNDGYKLYQKKDFAKASDYFSKAISSSEFIINNSLAKLTFDTTLYTLAGDAYQRNKDDEKATTYFRALADKKIGGEDYKFLYSFLMAHYFDKSMPDSFNHYRVIGKELYPTSDYFGYTEEDFILDMKDEDAKFKRLDAKMAAEPNNIKLQETYGLVLFDRLNKDGAASQANYNELEQKMTAMLEKSAAASPANAAKDYFYLGNYYLNKAVGINEKIKGVGEEIKAFNAANKPKDPKAKMPPVPKDMLDRRVALYKDYDAEVDKAVPYLSKAAEAYSKIPTLTPIEKQNYKKTADQLILIYGDKKNSSKIPADKMKYESEEKKWSTLYNSIH